MQTISRFLKLLLLCVVGTISIVWDFPRVYAAADVVKPEQASLEGVTVADILKAVENQLIYAAGQNNAGSGFFIDLAKIDVELPRYMLRRTRMRVNSLSQFSRKENRLQRKSKAHVLAGSL